MIRTETFRAEDFVKLPERNNPALLRSGGPIMGLEFTEGGKGYCRWTDEDGVKYQQAFPLECLWKLVPFGEPLA